MKWYVEAFKKYAVFSGRARRKEFWSFILFNIILWIVLVNIIELIDRPETDVFLSVLALATLLPWLAVSVRRLHDVGKSAWFLFIILIPFGNIFLIISFATAGAKGANEYGPDPKETGELPSTDVLDEGI